MGCAGTWNIFLLVWHTKKLSYGRLGPHWNSPMIAQNPLACLQLHKWNQPGVKVSRLFDTKQVWLWWFWVSASCWYFQRFVFQAWLYFTKKFKISNLNGFYHLIFLFYSFGKTLKLKLNFVTFATKMLQKCFISTKNFSNNFPLQPLWLQVGMPDGQMPLMLYGG